LAVQPMQEQYGTEPEADDEPPAGQDFDDDAPF
jgi:hypothetical protein